MDITITIPSPVLSAGESFSVTHNEYPNGAIIDDGIHTNAPFVVSGLLPDVLYEIHATLITPNGSCPPSGRFFIGTEDPNQDPCTCGAFTQLYVQKNCDGTSYLIAVFDSYFDGGCNFGFSYTGFNGDSPNTLTFNTLPPSLNIFLPTNSGTNPIVSLTLTCCSDNTTKSCFNGTITDIRDANCECDAPIFNDAWINYDDTTGDYKLCVNFGSLGGNYPPYTITWTQIGGTTSNDSGSDTTSNYGYFEYDILPSAFAGDLVYSVIVSNTCGMDSIQAKIKECGELIQFHDGNIYTTETTVEITDCTPYQLTFNTTSVPSKMMIEVDGVVQLDTGYLGSTTYQSALDAALSAMSLPPETITQSVGSNSLSFNNPSGAEYAQVSVYSPLPNTSWSYTIPCKVCPPPNQGVTIIVENTSTSNVTTVKVHGNPSIPSSYINFNPYQPQGQTDTFYNVDGWVGSNNSGVYLQPILKLPRIYKVDVIVNGTPISSATFSYSGTSQFHITAPTSGIVDGDEIRFRISST